MVNYIFSWLLLASVYVIASVTNPVELGIRFDTHAGGLPTLTLPYGTWRASKFDPNGDLYTFKNIRFGAPPVGDLRWAKPAPPAREATIQNGSYGPICVQSAAAATSFPSISLPSLRTMSEDCLFLDLYVPAKAIKNPSLKLPVISWFYGGGYTFGAKDQVEPVLPLYDGTGLIQVSRGNVIFVASNYRVGAYGFLAGTTMEKEGLPNTGFYDQRAALQWIQDHIHLVGGDRKHVNAWGESAGAGSILHHLSAFGGVQDPLFSRAVLQSAAYRLLSDRNGSLEQTFRAFATSAGCDKQGITCLRAASAKALKDANLALAGGLNTPLGPSADGKFVRQLAPLEFATGNFWKNISSIILSHTTHEGDTFASSSVQTDQDFDNYVDSQLPTYSKTAGVNLAVENHYPPVMNSTKPIYATETKRLIALLADASFQCNVRYLSDAYNGKNWNLQYSVPPGFHAVDLYPTFYNQNLNLSYFQQHITTPLIPNFASFAPVYQSYLVSHARTGNPNTFRKSTNTFSAIRWPRPENMGDLLTGVLNASDLGFSSIADELTGRRRCGFWQDVAAALTSLGGYAPPGSVVPTTLVPITNDPSANYAI